MSFSSSSSEDSSLSHVDQPDGPSVRRISVFSWNVKMAPLVKRRNKLGLGNRLMLALQKKSTKITIDIERTINTGAVSKSAKPDLSTLLNDAAHQELKDNERVLLRVWQRGEHPGNIESIRNSEMNKNGWVEQGRYRLEEVNIDKGVDGKDVKVQFGVGLELLSRQVKFENDDDAQRFQSALEKITMLEQDRGKRQLKKYLAAEDTETSLEDSAANDRIKLLIEIVCVTGIPKRVSPYVAIKMGGKVLHRTGYASSDTGSVIYTLTDGCFYLLDMTILEFFCSTGGMTFLVKAQDSIARRGRIVGQATVPLERILSATGERESYNLVTANDDTDSEDDSVQEKICIRIRRATSDDIEFMSAYRMGSHEEGVFSNETFLPIRPPRGGDALRFQRKLVPGQEMMYRVKPFPDPDRPTDTKWMTKNQIHEEAMKPSTHWVEAGSGAVGRVYVEVICCDGLPSMDFTGKISPRLTTDAFACLVFEDSIVNTDVIPNTRCPRWTPWCRRAFVFNVAHPSSNILLGLFDWDAERNPVQVAMSFASDVHDPIARIVVNVANVVPNTVYTVTYPLYFAKSVKYRQTSRGIITLRFRKEYCDYRKALWVGVKPPPMNYISVARKNDFAVAHYTTEGDLNEDAYSLKMLTSYIEEIQSYQVLLKYVKAAAVSVLLWRCHYKATIAGKEVILPLHSLTAFVWGIAVTINYNLFPSFVLFSIGWLMLACNDQARRAPSPWHQARRYPPILKAMLFNNTSPSTIEVNEGADAMAEYTKELEEKEERLSREREAEAEYLQTLRDELFLYADNEGNDDFVSSNQRFLDKIASANPILLPFKSTLYPIQKELRTRVLQLRIATSIITWQERIYAFWITTGSFVAAVACCWVPWTFLLRWILRLAVWIFLGPWTAIFVHYRFPEMHDMTQEEWEESLMKRLQEKLREALEASTQILIRKEHVLKQKSLARWMFGKYHLRVPSFTEQLFPDIPMPSSFAEPYSLDTCPPIEIKERVYGQNLYGDMIPKREVQVNASTTRRAKENIFLEAGLKSYFQDAYGWVQFLNVRKAAYGVGYGMAKGQVYAKASGNDAILVGFSTMRMASAGLSIGVTLASEIIFFQDKDAFERFSKGKFTIEGGAKVTVLSLSADYFSGRSRAPISDRFNVMTEDEDTRIRYHRGMATFVITTAGMMLDVGVVGQKFSFHTIPQT